MDALPAHISALSAQVANNPDLAAFSDLLLAYLQYPELHAHPARIEHICTYVRTFPEEPSCRTTLVTVDPVLAPQGFDAVRKEWETLLAARPTEPSIVMEAAYCLAMKDPSEAVGLLQAFLASNDDHPTVWFELGRITQDPGQRFESYRRARELGAENPNLVTWLGTAAVEVGELSAAEAIGNELLQRADEARAAFGGKLDWTETGKALWDQAMSEEGSKAPASQLVHAIGEHANNKHWGNTLVGMVRLRRSDVEGAARCLLDSAEVVGSSRLRSYGPATMLAAGLCHAGRWTDVETYLKRCSVFFVDEGIAGWIEQVRQRENPSFPRT